MAEKSRAEYFKQRRERKKAFNYLIDKEKMECLEKYLEKEGKTKSKWLNEKIDEVLKYD